jgi:hypothetical protein
MSNFADCTLLFFCYLVGGQGFASDRPQFFQGSGQNPANGQSTNRQMAVGGAVLQNPIAGD